QDLIVLRDDDLEVEAGQLQVVLGRNGAGKTSLMSAIAGLLPTVRSGTVAVNGRDVTRLPAHKRAAAGVGLVQEGKRIFRKRTVEENLLLGTYSASEIGRAACREGGWRLERGRRRGEREIAHGCT